MSKNVHPLKNVNSWSGGTYCIQAQQISSEPDPNASLYHLAMKDLTQNQNNKIS